MIEKVKQQTQKYRQQLDSETKFHEDYQLNLIIPENSNEENDSILGKVLANTSRKEENLSKTAQIP